MYVYSLFYVYVCVCVCVLMRACVLLLKSVFFPSLKVWVVKSKLWAHFFGQVDMCSYLIPPQGMNLLIFI